MNTYDPGKEARNLAKHGVSLQAAELLDWEAALIWEDQRKDYGETRWIALAPLNDRLYCCVYVDRGKQRRIISLRKANQREFDHYVQAIDQAD